MSWRLPETGLAFLIAAELALVGELLLRRRSIRLSSWVESFLVGGGVAATALYPLSLVLPGRALEVLEFLIAAAAVAAVIRRIRNRKALPGPPAEKTSEDHSLLREPLSIAFLGVTVAAAVVFAVLNWRYTYLWDGFQIWAARAQVLYYQGDLVPHLVLHDYTNRTLEYPALVPLFEALLSILRGGFDFDGLKPIFLVFYLAMVVETWRAARAVAPRPLAFAATALLCLSPLVSTRGAAGGYADMPQAACVAGVLAALLAGESAAGGRPALPWLIGSLVTVKSEGIILAAVCCVTAAAYTLLRRDTRRPDLRAAVSFLAPPALFIALRFAYLRWVRSGDPTYAPLNPESFTRALSRLKEVLELCAKHLADAQSWGFLWPAFFVAVVCLFVTAALPLVRAVAAATVFAVAAYMAVFLFTNWPVPLHIEQAFPRLLQQLAPAAAVAIVAAFTSLWSSAAGGRDGESRARAEA